VHSRNTGWYPGNTWTFTDPLHPPTVSWPTGTPPPYYTYNDNRTVAYGNDVMTLTNRIKLSAGVAYAHQIDVCTSCKSKKSDGGASWRVGPIIQVTPHSVVFFDYSSAFIPQSPGTNKVTNTAYNYPALTGHQIEGGYKVAITNSASVTAALYQLTEQNVQTPSTNLTKQTEGINDVTGEVRSRGAELDASYKVIPGWNVLFAYAYTNAQVTANNQTSNDNVIGSPEPNVPKHTGRLWMSYEIQSGTFRHLGVGGGTYAISDRRTDIPTYSSPTFYATMGGYATVDALAYYAIKGWKVSANFTNLSDRHYWETVSIPNAYPGRPFTATFRVQKTFGGYSSNK
jgi:iron complex outermembrane receptor protein